MFASESGITISPRTTFFGSTLEGSLRGILFLVLAARSLKLNGVIVCDFVPGVVVLVIGISLDMSLVVFDDSLSSD